MRVSLSGAWLDVDLPEEHRALSWAILGGGFTTARRVSWRQVTNADLPVGLDPVRWIAADLRNRGKRSDVVLLTSRRISAWERSDVDEDDVRVSCVATVGLSNALRVGASLGVPQGSAIDPVGLSRRTWGTINLLCCVDHPLSDPAMVEALSVATEARTLAVLERCLPVDGGDATGTGTDCIVIASPTGLEGSEAYAGKHTAVGRAIGKSVREAVGRGADRWVDESQSMSEGRGRAR